MKIHENPWIFLPKSWKSFRSPAPPEPPVQWSSGTASPRGVHIYIIYCKAVSISPRIPGALASMLLCLWESLGLSVSPFPDLKRARQKFLGVHRCLVQKKKFFLHQICTTGTYFSPPSIFCSVRGNRKVRWFFGRWTSISFQRAKS